MAAVALARRMATAGVPWTTLSAGTCVTEVRPATAEAIAAAQERRLDLTNHASRALDSNLVANADLVIGMTREHARQVVTLERTAFLRIFTLKELVRRGEASPRGDEDFADWLVALAADRGIEELLGSSPQDDISDPIGQPLSAFRTTIAELDDLADRLVRAAWPRKD